MSIFWSYVGFRGNVDFFVRECRLIGSTRFFITLVSFWSRIEDTYSKMQDVVLKHILKMFCEDRRKFIFYYFH